MSDKYIEKSFIYLVTFSFLLHLAVFVLVAFLPGKKNIPTQEPYMVELEEMPQLKDSGARPEKKTKRESDATSRTDRERAPKGEMQRERVATLPRSAPPLIRETPSRAQKKSTEDFKPRETGTDGIRKAPAGRDLLKKRDAGLPEIARLYPSAGRLANLEENYRKKYETEVEEGETKFLNTDDILFGSFLRRFETAVYGVWRYPPDAARLGIEGVTPVKITFNRKGEVENVQLLDSSGSKILDNEVFRTLRMIGPVGSFPKGYGKEKFSLIAFFQYGIIRGASRGMLH